MVVPFFVFFAQARKCARLRYFRLYNFKLRKFSKLFIILSLDRKYELLSSSCVNKDVYGKFDVFCDLNNNGEIDVNEESVKVSIYAVKTLYLRDLMEITFRKNAGNLCTNTTWLRKSNLVRVAKNYSTLVQYKLYSCTHLINELI
jgi:hypothetical protein